jgi:hypothetical protein
VRTSMQLPGVVRLAVFGWDGSLLGMMTSPNPDRVFRFPAEIIEHAVWLYHCFSLNLREVELVPAARGVVVSYESVREWGLRFGRLFANPLTRRRPRPGDKWHLEEAFIRVRGKLTTPTGVRMGNHRAGDGIVGSRGWEGNAPDAVV